SYPNAAGPLDVQLTYDTKGHAVGLSDAGSGAVFWSWIAGDDLNRVASDGFGPNTGITRTSQFDDWQDGVLTSIKTTHGTDILQDLVYDHDANRNLTARTDNGKWLWQGVTGAKHTEYFCYDGLNRLTDGSLDTPAVCGAGKDFRYTYDADGDIT